MADMLHKRRIQHFHKVVDVGMINSNAFENAVIPWSEFGDVIHQNKSILAVHKGRISDKISSRMLPIG